MDRIKKILKITFVLLMTVYFYSCSPTYLNGYSKLENSDMADPALFPGDFNKATYKTTIKVMGNELSGILLVKKTKAEEFRFVFVSEIGMKYFDIGISPKAKKNQQTIYYLMPALNRGGLEKILFDDFEKMTPLNPGQLQGHYRQKETGVIALKYQMENCKTVYFLDVEDKKISTINWKSKVSGKSQIELSFDGKQIPSNMKVNNKKYGVYMKMKIITPIGKTSQP